MKKFLALVLVTVLTLSLSANVFAAENEENILPENAETHTIEMTIEPGEEYGIMPCIWDEYDGILPGHVSYQYSSSFYVPDRNLGFTVTATNNSSPIEFLVQIYYSTNTGLIFSGKSGLFVSNGVAQKSEDFDLSYSGRTCLFCINNPGTTTLTVHIEYYSW